MSKALVFPGQGAQFPGMGKDLFEQSSQAKELFLQANEILGFDISDIMFKGSKEDLTKTSVTQPAIFIHSVVLAKVLGLDKNAAMLAGHSLGEFSALTVGGSLDFADGLKLVSIRANAMQKACDAQESTMAAIVGMEDADVEAICERTEGVVVAANYNSPGQVVISGDVNAVSKAAETAKENGARMAIILQVDGAFHSPLMESAREELARGISETNLNDSSIPVYQNVTASAETEAAAIRENLISQLTAPVKWTQTIQQMIEDGADEFVEVGPGNVLQGLIKRINRKMNISGVQAIPEAQ